jgi:hypothetical protein
MIDEGERALLDNERRELAADPDWKRSGDREPQTVISDLLHPILGKAKVNAAHGNSLSDSLSYCRGVKEYLLAVAVGTVARSRSLLPQSAINQNGLPR